MTTAEPRSDGRTERSRRTRLTVAGAMLDLINAGELRPTAQQVSAQAGVSLRTVFHHFEDIETLFATAADIQIERMAKLAADIPSDLPFAKRLELFVKARSRLLEDITPVRRGAILHEPFSRVVARRLAWIRNYNREETERVFAAELAALPEPVHALTTPALLAASEWPTWESMRAHQSLTFENARDVMSHTIRALLRKEID